MILFVLVVRYVMFVVVIVVMVVQTSLLSGFLQFDFEGATDRGIFLFLLDLFDFKGDAQSLRKVSFGDGKISSRCHADVEVLVEPEERRGNHRASLFPKYAVRVSYCLPCPNTC